MVRFGSSLAMAPATVRRSRNPFSVLVAVLLVGCGAAAVTAWTGAVHAMTPDAALAVIRQDPEPDHVRGAATALYRHTEEAIVELRKLALGTGPVADNARAMLDNLRDLLKE